MKIFTGVVIFACLAFPAFSQQRADIQRYTALGNTMDTVISAGSATLTDFDGLIKDDGTIKNYTSYKRRYDSLAAALQASEDRLNFLIRTTDRTAYIQEERDNYERLLNEIQTIKSEYDTWLRSVQ